jgi:hypothetical protein
MSDTEISTGRKGNLPGLYRSESGAEIITTADGKIGSAMSDGAVQAGFKYIGPAPKETETKVAPEAKK